MQLLWKFLEEFLNSVDILKLWLYCFATLLMCFFVLCWRDGVKMDSVRQRGPVLDSLSILRALDRPLSAPPAVISQLYKFFWYPFVL